MNIKKIIKEEIDDLDWVQNTFNNPLSKLDKAYIMEKFIEENEKQVLEADRFVKSFWREYGDITGNFSVNDLRAVVTVMFAQQFNSK